MLTLRGLLPHAVEPFPWVKVPLPTTMIFKQQYAFIIYFPTKCVDPPMFSYNNTFVLCYSPVILFAYGL